MDWTPPPKEDEAKGECHYDLKTIQVDGNRDPHTQDFMDTVVHETAHAAAPYLSEEAVETISNAIASVLWKVGYRCV